MASTGLRAFRIWMIILTFTNLVFITIHYAEEKYWSNSRNYRIYNYIGKGPTLKSDKFFLWQDWTLIVSSSVLFLAYIYTYKVITTRLHKYLRAMLMLVPTVLVLFVGIQYIHLVLSLDYPMPDGPLTPCDCAYLSGLERMYCGVVEFSYFLAIVTGLFALLEIYATIRKGPMLPKGYHQSYIPNVGYAEGVNVEYVRPPEIPMTKQHQQRLQDPHGGGGGNQQISTSDQPFLLFSPNQNTPIHPSGMEPATTSGPQPLQQLLQILPEEVFDERAPLPHHHIYAPQPFYNDIPSVGAEVLHRQLDQQPPVNTFMGYPPPAPQRYVYIQPQPQEEEFDERAPLPHHHIYGAPLPLRPPQPFMSYNIQSVGTEVPFVRRQYPPPAPQRQVYVQPQPHQQRPSSQQQQPPQPQEEEFDNRAPLSNHHVYNP